MRRALVWDLPTRLFHGLLILVVLGLWVSAKIGSDAMVWHMRLGYTGLGLLLFRVLWGFVGGYWSRFAHFPVGFRSVWAYLAGSRAPHLHRGHNPLGSWSVLAMLSLLFLQVGSGLFADDEIAWMGPLSVFAPSAWVQLATHYHKNVGQWLLLVLLGLHVLAVLFYTYCKHQALLAAMWHGHKNVGDQAPQSIDTGKRRILALVLLMACVLLVYGLLGWAQRTGLSQAL
jgi:cytochrome b